MRLYKKVLLSFSICTFLISNTATSFAVLANGKANAGSAPSNEYFGQNILCGVWDVGFPDPQDPRLLLEQINQTDTGTDCRTDISIINNTGIPINIKKILSVDVLSYSLELFPQSENARIEWKYPNDQPIDHYFAIQSLDTIFGIFPINPQQNAKLDIEGRLTRDSLKQDITLIIIFELIKLNPCIPVQEATFTAINIANRGVLDKTAQLLLDHKYVELKKEWNNTVPEFVNTFLEELVVECVEGAAEKIVKDFIGVLPSLLLGTIWYGTHVAADYYLRYHDSSVNLTASYRSKSPLVPDSPSLDKNDLSSVMQWMTSLMKDKEPMRINPLIGSSGTVFAPYAIGAQPKGSNNSNEIVKALETALRISEPVCIGYDPNFGTLPDKAIIYFQGVTFEESQVGVTNENVTGFQFFKLQDGWELIFITPIPEWGVPEQQSLTLCPGETSNIVTPVPVENLPSPVQPLDRMSAESVMEWISHGLTYGDSSVFEELLIGNSISYGTGFAGGRHEIPRDEFLSMLRERIISQPTCEGYVDNETTLSVWTSGWSPGWPYEGTSNDVLTFFLLNIGEGFSISSAYFTPAPAILEVVDHKPCPAVP